MARQPRSAPAGLVYHILNRAVAKMQLFRHDRDFEAFERVILEAHQRHPIRILSFCVMSNHWHFVVWPQKDDEVTNFFRWLTHTHAMRWRVSHNTVGYGPLYQGRFKSFPVQEDEHLLTVCRYVERNPVAAEIVPRAQQWRWSSLWIRLNGTPQQKSLLSPWPIHPPPNWLETVNRSLKTDELSPLKSSLERNRPFGSEQWISRMAARLKLEHTLRREGRPNKPAPQN